MSSKVADPFPRACDSSLSLPFRRSCPSPDSGVRVCSRTRDGLPPAPNPRPSPTSPRGREETLGAPEEDGLAAGFWSPPPARRALQTLLLAPGTRLRRCVCLATDSVVTDVALSMSMFICLVSCGAQCDAFDFNSVAASRLYSGPLTSDDPSDAPTHPMFPCVPSVHMYRYDCHCLYAPTNLGTARPTPIYPYQLPSCPRAWKCTPLCTPTSPRLPQVAPTSIIPPAHAPASERARRACPHAPRSCPWQAGVWTAGRASAGPRA